MKNKTYSLLLEEESWLLPCLRVTENSPFAYWSLSQHRVCTCSPSQRLAPVPPTWNRTMVDVLPLWGTEGHRELSDSHELNWERKTGFMPFLLCDLENPHSLCSRYPMCTTGIKRFLSFSGWRWGPSYAPCEKVLVSHHACRHLGYHRIKGLLKKGLGMGNVVHLLEAGRGPSHYFFNLNNALNPLKKKSQTASTDFSDSYYVPLVHEET